MKAVRVAATGVRADRIVHDDVASGDELGQGEGGAVTHDQPAKCRREGGVSCYTF
jgi:hypothetical protein